MSWAHLVLLMMHVVLKLRIQSEVRVARCFECYVLPVLQNEGDGDLTTGLIPAEESVGFIFEIKHVPLSLRLPGKIISVTEEVCL